MARPIKVRVFGRNYCVEYLPTTSMTDHTLLGLCDNIEQTISVKEGLTNIEEADTILHEVMHAIFFTMKIDLDEDIEEKVISALSTGLIGVLQDNKEFAKWLIEDKNKP